MRLYIHNTDVWMYIHTCSYGSNFPKTWRQNFITRYVQRLVSLWETFRTINLEVLSCNIYVSKHSSPRHSNDEAEDTFPQVEWREYRHHSFSTAASPMSNTIAFIFKVKKWQYKSQIAFISISENIHWPDLSTYPWQGERKIASHFFSKYKVFSCVSGMYGSQSHQKQS